ncbi:MAG: thiamine phosphate synthase [Aquisalimonadaceae bacterium]
MPVRGLYAITDAGASGPEALVARVTPVLAAGARVLQYRDKSSNALRRLREAQALAAACRDYGALFIVNDDIDLAAACGAGGVHLGRDDVSIAEARRRLGNEAMIGVSCYASLERAGQMQEAGADYLAFGAVYPSVTKPHTVRAELALLRQARARFALPLVAIGGITAANARDVVATGVDAVAVIQGVFGASDPALAARHIAALFAG